MGSTAMGVLIQRGWKEKIIIHHSHLQEFKRMQIMMCYVMGYAS